MWYSGMRSATTLVSVLCLMHQVAAVAEVRFVQAPPGKALIYILQGNAGRYATVPVAVNGRPVGSVTAQSYLVVAVDPGSPIVGATAGAASATRLKVEKSKIYYLNQEVNPGGIPVFRVLPEKEGRDLLARYRPARTDVVVVGAPVATPSAPRPAAAPAVASREGSSLLLFKLGKFKVSEEEQEWLNVESTVDTDASSVIAIEYDYFFANQWALGAEVVSYKNSWTRANGTDGSVSTRAYLINGKKYFTATNMVRPFVGVGIGLANTDFSGDLTGGGAGIAYQLLGGVEFRFGNVGVHLEYKQLSADTEADNDVKIDASGGGLFAGLAVNF